jgi:hypothetical protein
MGIHIGADLDGFRCRVKSGPLIFDAKRCGEASYIPGGQIAGGSTACDYTPHGVEAPVNRLTVLIFRNLSLILFFGKTRTLRERGHHDEYAR